MLTALPRKGKSNSGGFCTSGARWWCGTESEASAAAHNLLISVEIKIRPTGQIGDALVCWRLPGQSFGRLLFLFIFSEFWFNAAK
ncbi:MULTISPECIES: hypothetical protein [Bacteroides]|nr:hypothetical protein [Bacteroides intestinalis]